MQTRRVAWSMDGHLVVEHEETQLDGLAQRRILWGGGIFKRGVGREDGSLAVILRIVTREQDELDECRSTSYPRK